MKPIVYLTFNDAPSGIYFGQVVDVCRFLSKIQQRKVILIAFFSIRNFSANKKTIRAQYENAIVLPMFPKTRNWRKNLFFLKRKIRKLDPEAIISRGPFAYGLVSMLDGKYRRCFDGRGAYIAEMNEFNVDPDEKVVAEVPALEKKAVMESDFRIAVSDALVNYWKETFNYQSQNHVVIPCTLNSNSENNFLSKEALATGRKNMGYNDGAVVIVYSGSGAGWQSLEELDQLLEPSFTINPNLHLLLLVRLLPDSFQLARKFPERVKQRWLDPHEVGAILNVCDYGWLVRNDAVTNKVASPVKFAEYLASGLKVIISKSLGDYSRFVEEHNAGIIFENPERLNDLIPVSYEEKKQMNQLSTLHFNKSAYKEKYLQLIG